MPRVKPIKTFKAHAAKWKDCERCQFHKRRKNVVLARGKLPCDVLFIGEAPGVSEDVFGVPFYGPAGKLLDQMIEMAGGDRFRIAITNVLACIPKNDNGDKIHNGDALLKEHDDCLETCGKRLTEFARIAQPKLIVLVGRTAAKRVMGQASIGGEWLPPATLQFCEIAHPAYLLRLDISMRALTIQENTINLQDAFDILYDEVCPF